ncbi:DUF1572 family protein [Exiguobacterium aurantiacum]|uniref:DUF1572 family protein n=1 Tax=Exiguobacterium aurantiacum TaxID=33987 RepID=UPI00349FB258
MGRALATVRRCLGEPHTGRHRCKTVFIRGEEKSVIWAIEKQVSHYSYHVGQIVYLAKVFAGETWNVLTIPLPHQR